MAWRRIIQFPELEHSVQMPSADSDSSSGSWLELGVPGRPAQRRYDVPVRGLNPALDGLRIIHLSDLHMRGHWHEAHEQLLADVRHASPDVILFTGDFIESKYDHRPALPHLHRLLDGLAARYGIFAILGNHDPDVVRPHVAAHGVRFVTHRRVMVQAGDAEIEIIGLPGLSRADLDMSFIRRQPPPTQGVPRIVLSHYPDLFTAARNLEMDLYLCGHTHGGQVCFPDGTPPLTHDAMPKKLCKGFHRIGKTWMGISSGLGFSGLTVRLFCPTEFAELTLRCAPSGMA
jgi:uncharacterized protein